jgi:phosphate uptake regulator
MEKAYATYRTDQNQETRKIQYTGGSSYIVSLPKKWVQDLGLKQGDNVVILRQGNSLLQLAPASKRTSKEQLKNKKSQRP